MVPSHRACGVSPQALLSLRYKVWISLIFLPHATTRRPLKRSRGRNESGRRPSLLQAGDPARAEQLYEEFVHQFRRRGIDTQTGSFGAVMRVGLENAGPVTLVLSTDEWTTRV